MYVEPLSGKVVRVHSGCLIDTDVHPSAGGFQALLDSSVMACQARVNDMMEHFSKAVFNQTGTNINVRLEESNVIAALVELEKSRARMKSHLLRSQHDVERRLERAAILAVTGGCPGIVIYPALVLFEQANCIDWINFNYLLSLTEKLLFLVPL